MVGKAQGAHPDKKLSAAFVRTVKDAGFYADGNGLYLKVDSHGAKRWVQRIVISGKRRDVGLGSARLIPLAEARETALQNRKAARQGKDPIADKKREQGVLTFEEAAREVHRLNEPTWRNDKHGKQWLATMESFVFPHFGPKRITLLTSADVLTALTPIWNTHPETARRVKQRVGSVFKWAIAMGWRVDNPADAITKALPRHDRSTVQHRKALPYDQVGGAIRAVQSSKASAVTKLAFEFLVLTACRSGEVLKATWNEVDTDKAEWTIPASRMKAKKAHRVPLSPRCLSILNEANAFKQPECDLVFPGSKQGRPLSDMTLSKLMKELAIPAVPHGFRSSFRDWAGEQTHHAREVIEFALAHVIKDKAEAAYARSDLYEKRIYLMKDWSIYVGTLPLSS
ncbi:MAG TPA: integrase arm-type DNA-binding domain-containing protein [Burkholderiales bacterium]|nr:integrase arm-type DNA-binding domain-containing protein [Burkholderiales bacterium]